MAGSQQDWGSTPSPVADQNRQGKQQGASEPTGKTPSPGEQPEQEGSATRQQESGAGGNASSANRSK
ncbi:MAG: hypothetical protein JWO31_1138 [Phycisphaerales bacterium]|nr:hypothetical protein [Phycisphaerales bacterium]